MLKFVFIACTSLIYSLTAIATESPETLPSANVETDAEAQALVTTPLRAALKNQGLDLALEYTGEFVAVTNGGLKKKICILAI